MTMTSPSCRTEHVKSFGTVIEELTTNRSLIIVLEGREE